MSAGPFPLLWLALDGGPLVCALFIDDGNTRRCDRCGWWRSSHYPEEAS